MSLPTRPPPPQLYKRKPNYCTPVGDSYCPRGQLHKRGGLINPPPRLGPATAWVLPRLPIPACVAVPPRPAPILALDPFPPCAAVPPPPAPPLQRVQRDRVPGCPAIAGKVLRYRGRPPRKVLRYLGARKRGLRRVIRYRGERGFPAIAGGGGTGTLRDKDAGCLAIAGVGRPFVTPVCAWALASAQSSRRRLWRRKSAIAGAS